VAVQAKGKARKNFRSKRLRPLDTDFFRFAEKVSLVFDRPYAAKLRFLLLEQASAFRNRYRPHDAQDMWATKTKWTAFLLRLILTCPRILSRPPDFEWVMDDLEWILSRRKFNPGVDRDFWKAVDRVRSYMRTGHPLNKGTDYLRFEMVQTLMNPPEQLKDLLISCGKEEALRRAADMEEAQLGVRPHERVVRRSYDRVERELQQLHDLLSTVALNRASDKPAKKPAYKTRHSIRPKARRY
jgi:hypothetical protein